MNQSIEYRLERLEAAEGVRALKMKYARLCDQRYPPVELSDLFMDDAVWDSGSVWGRHVGRTAIQEFFKTAESIVSWATHYTVSGDVDVSEDLKSATGLWYLWQPMTMSIDGKDRAVILIADYVDHYVKHPDRGWLYQSLKLNVQKLTTLDEGWALRPML